MSNTHPFDMVMTVIVRLIIDPIAVLVLGSVVGSV